MRILLIAQHFSRSNANTFRYRDLVRGLSKNGHIVDVIGDRRLSGYESPPEVTYYSLWDDIRFRTFFSVLWYTVIYFFRLYPVWNFLRNKYLAYTIFICGAARYRIGKLLRNAHYDVIVVSITPWTYHVFSKYLSRHSKLILDIGDPLYKNAFLDKTKTGSRIFFRFERNSINYASYVLFMSEPLQDIYNEMGIDRNTLEFLSPSTNTDIYQRGESYVYRADRTRPLEFVYAGLLYPGYRDLKKILPAISELDRVQFTIITSSKVPQNRNVVREKWMDQTELKKRYRQADILLFVDNFYGFQIPSKIFELIATHKPILFVYDRRNSYLYEKLKGQKGIFFAENDTDDIRHMVEYILSLDCIEVCYSLDMEKNSETYITNRYITIIDNVAKNVQR